MLWNIYLSLIVDIQGKLSWEWEGHDLFLAYSYYIVVSEETNYVLVLEWICSKCCREFKTKKEMKEH